MATEYLRAFGALRGFARRHPVMERCEVCGVTVSRGHAHLLDPASRKILCSCQGCAMLFSASGDGRFRRIPERVLFLANFEMTNGEWDSMMIPIGMAFFFRNSATSKMLALYPGPGGAVESLLSLDTWTDISLRNPVLEEMEPDVEALLVNRLGMSRGFANSEYYLLPIDECFKLVGLIRSHWRGLSGGSEVWEEMSAYFGELKKRARAHAGGVCA